MSKSYIKISKPYIEEIDSEVRLCSDLDIAEKKYKQFFSVDKKYGKYLVDDRADAFFVSLFMFAMKNGMDIISEAPITKKLLWQIKNYLMPMIVSNIDKYQMINIMADGTEKILECEGAVVTGWTGGVDSMYTLMKSMQSETFKLTHLFIANNGALEDADNRKLLNLLVEKAKNTVAKKFGLEVIGINSNIQDIVDETFRSRDTVRHPACILALQKLFKVYLESSSYEFRRFSFIDDDASIYELASLNLLETDNTTIYSAYGSTSRIQKIIELSNFEFAYKYLYPCIHPGKKNCGKCGKCIRTEVALYALGKLDKFAEAFDVKEFYKNKELYIAQVLANRQVLHYGEVGQMLQIKNVEIPENSYKLARIMKAAKKVVDEKKEELISMKKNLSVIIPAYNAEKYLKQAIDSVKRQNWNGNVEIIVIDDGSNDDTLKIANEHADIVLTQERKGAASARNQGIEKASGDMILFLDSDDILTEGSLENLYVPFLKNEKLMISFSKAEDFISPEIPDEEKKKLKPREQPYGGVLPGCSLMKKDIFNEIGIFEENFKSAETVSWLIKLREERIPSENIEYVTLKRRLHLNNTGRVNKKEEIKNYADIIRRRMKKR